MTTPATPLVSVCIPTYNDGPFLQQSLASIVAQTYTHLEMLVADDASTDNTAEIVESFHDPRIYYHRHLTNLGQFENVNSLIRRASGKYIAIYHSDDLYTPQIVEKEVAFLESHPDVGAVFTLDWRINNNGQLIGQMKLLPDVQPRIGLSLADVMPLLLRHKNRLLRGPTFMSRAEVFAKVGCFTTEYDIAGDFEMWLRIMSVFKIAILDEPLMYYRRGSTQVSSRYNKLRTFEEHYFTIMDHYLDRINYKDGVDRVSFAEYAFHRCDDETFRASSFVIQGKATEALTLLTLPFPWRTFTHFTPDIQWRKVRVLLLRMIMRLGLALNAVPLLARLLRWTEYRGQV